MSRALVCLLLSLDAPPTDAPPVDEPSGDERTSEGSAADKTRGAPPRGRDESKPPVDERGEPILDYGEAPDPASELVWADETPPPPEVEYAETTPDPGADLEYRDGQARPAPSEAALDRQSTVDRRARARKKKPLGPGGSPQRFAFELKFGPYIPSVDRVYEGPGLGPYAQIFGRTNSIGEAIGQPKPGLMTMVHFEWQFAKAAGPFFVGTSMGFFQDSAQALIAEPELVDQESVRSGADKVRFNTIPMTLLLGYRFELLADRYKVPFVPYAKAGLAYGWWWSRDGNKELSRDTTGDVGRGGTGGWTVVLGGMLRLDFIDPGTARDLDRTTGINHTYLFGEYQFMRLDGLGRRRGLDVGDDTFFVGLAIEF